MGQKYWETEDQKPGPGLARNHDFAKGEEPEAKVFRKLLNWKT